MAELLSSISVPQEFAGMFSFQKKEEEREFFLDFLEKSAAHKAEFQRTWDELLDNYMVIPQRSAFERVRVTRNLVNFPLRPRDRSRLKDPETHQVVETLVAQAMGLLMSSREYVSVSPRGSDDYERKRLLSRLIQAVLEQPGWFRTQYQAIKDAFIFGTSIVELTWLTRARMQMQRAPVFDEEGNFIGSGLEPQEVIYFDGPLFKNIDIYDFYPDPGGTRINEDMEFVAKRGKTTVQKAMELVEAGVYEREPTMRAIAAAQEQQKAYGRQPMFGQEKKFPNVTNETPDQYGMMTFFEGIGEVPYSPQDGYRNRVLTMLNGEIVRSHINPMIDGGKWFKELIVNPISGRFYGLAPTEAVRFLQDATDQLLMVFTDVAGLAAHGPLLMAHSFGGNANRLRKRIPLDVIECADPNMVKPYPIDIGSLGFAMQEIARRKNSIREATGASNPLQAISPGDRSTATEVSELIRLASQRVDLMVQLIERDDYPWIGRTLLSRLKQFAPPGGVSAIFRGERIDVNMEDIEEADVRFSGSRHALTVFQQAAQMREAITVLSQNPEFVVTYPELGVIYLRDILHLPNAEEVIQRASQQAQAQQLLQQALLQQQKTQRGGGSARLKDSSFGTEVGETQREGRRVA